jgi:hypothetical protein
MDGKLKYLSERTFMRRPVVAGQFYPGTKEALMSELDILLSDFKDKRAVKGIMSPHAGYMFSGAVAGKAFAGTVPADTYIILGPSHTGKGARMAVSTETWTTPMGKIEIDEGLINSIMNLSDILEKDNRAHTFEHSIEVQIPFIQRISPGAKIVAITVQHGNIEEYENLASALAGALEQEGRNAVLVASTDMTHYEPRRIAEYKDKMAINEVLKLDGKKLLRVVKQNNISMCGYIPTAIMLMAVRKMGAEKAELVKYTDSGEVTGDTSEVVGYAGVVIY